MFYLHYKENKIWKLTLSEWENQFESKLNLKCPSRFANVYIPVLCEDEDMKALEKHLSFDSIGDSVIFKKKNLIWF